MRSDYRLLSCFILLIALVSAACKQQKETPPVPEAKMEAILLDIHLAEAYSLGLGDSMKNRFEKNYDTLGDFYHSIFRHHKISPEAFNSGLQWYKERPGLVDSLYVKVLGRLTELKASKGIRDIDAEGATVDPVAAAGSAGIDAITKTDSAAAAKSNKKAIKTDKLLPTETDGAPK